MKLLSRLFGATPDDAPPAEVSEQMVPKSADVRLEAIGKLPDGRELRQLAGLEPMATEPVPVEARAAQARLAQLVDNGSVEAAALTGTGPSIGAWLAIAAQCQDPTLLPSAMAAIDDVEQKLLLVTHGTTSRIRQLAAETVHDAIQLRDLLRQVRDKDKSVYKILRQKLDHLLEKDRLAAEIIAEIDSICAALERHSLRSFDPLYAGVFEHHHHRWLALRTPPDDTQSRRATAAIARSQAVIAEHALQLAQQTQRDAELAAAHEMQRSAAAAAEADAALKAQAEAEVQAREQEAITAARMLDDAVRAEQAAVEQQVLRQIGGLLRKANAALTGGQSQSAAGLRRAIDEKLTAATAAGTSIPVHFLKGVQQLDDRLNELKQWKSFAVAPKRIELIRDMELLVGSTEEPKVLAERIKALQEDWKTISKGLVSEDSDDWEKFHNASQAAYKPCREYFETQSKLRRENVARRQSVLMRVLAFEANANSETLDWRLTSSVLREAPLEWRSHSPVEREAAQALQVEFDAAMRRLQATLNTWYERNIAVKEILIDQARQLLNLEDGREAVEMVKRFQTQWKEIGPAPREQEQALWRKFREHCDAVFQKRQQAHALYSAALEASTTQAAALCTEIEASAALTGALLAEATAKVSTWRTAFEALGELPRAEARGLQRRFEQAINRLDSAASQQRARDAQRSITDVFESVRQIRACEWAAMRDEPESVRAPLRQETETFLGAIKRGPAGSNQALKEALARCESASSQDMEVREKALRVLCIRCEILRDLASPVEDEGLRRDYQVQRLMQGLGQGHAGNPDWNDMLVEWIRVSAIAPPEHDKLQARFMKMWLDNAADEKRTSDPARRERQPARGRS